jgi:hypothetical protein
VQASFFSVSLSLPWSHFLDFPFTRFSLGFFFFALALALREAEANIAPAAFLEYPPFLAMLACTDLKLIIS